MLDQDQIHYLKSVLGLDRVLLPLLTAEDATASPLAPQFPEPRQVSRGDLQSARMIALLPLAPEDFPLRGEADTLVDKMVRAMKIDPAEVYFFQFECSEGASEAPHLQQTLSQIATASRATPTVLFGADCAREVLGLASNSIGSGAWCAWGQGGRVMATFSPRELIQTPDKKRVTWIHLQAVMKELG
jgi:hypothetical protein